MALIEESERKAILLAGIALLSLLGTAGAITALGGRCLLEDQSDSKESDDTPAADAAAPAASTGGGASAAPGGASASGVFDITKFEAKPDGRSESAQAFIKAWNAACKSQGAAQVLIPKGDFATGEVVLQGPCTAKPLTIQIEGNLLAQKDLSAFTHGVWIEMEHVDGVVVTGGGTFNGQGEASWRFGKCTGDDCGESVLPTSFVIGRAKNVEMHNLKFLNSKGFHLKVHQSTGVNVHHLNIVAPEESPNTDGVHISDSGDVNVTHSAIGTGDDCISIGESNTNIFVTNVTCGPGHGISIGSLGKRVDDTDVKGVKVINCTLSHTTNGARIKTHHNSPKLVVSGIVYENIIFNNVSNPIIIDQHYSAKHQDGESQVQITDTHFRNIRGTTPSKFAVNLNCSSAVPCQGIELTDINITPVNPSVAPASACENVKATYSGTQNPAACAA